MIDRMRFPAAAALAAALAAGMALPGAAQASEQLARKNACMSCHALDKKIVGPGFRDVAAELKKKGGEERALKAIVSGSKGTWSPVPMPPMKGVSEKDAKELAKWLAEGAR